MIYKALALAMLPVLVLVWHIYKRDKYQPEPTLQLLFGAAWGVVAAMLTSVVVRLTFSFMGHVPCTTIGGCAYNAFFMAAIPEECLKALCLYLFLRRNKYFDEYMDGIVYAVAVGMGFAGLENVYYLLAHINQWVSLGVTRGLLSVPGHFAYGVLMGYYFSLWRIRGRRSAFWMMLAMPILAHGVFDFALFYMGLTGASVMVLFCVMALLMHMLRKYCSRMIERLLKEDQNKPCHNISMDVDWVSGASYVIFPIGCTAWIVCMWADVPYTAWVRLVTCLSAVCILVMALRLMLLRRVDMDRIFAAGHARSVYLVACTIMSVPVVIYSGVCMARMHGYDIQAAGIWSNGQAPASTAWSILYHFIDAGNQHMSAPHIACLCYS